MEKSPILPITSSFAMPLLSKYPVPLILIKSAAAMDFVGAMRRREYTMNLTPFSFENSINALAELVWRI